MAHAAVLGQTDSTLDSFEWHTTSVASSSSSSSAAAATGCPCCFKSAARCFSRGLQIPPQHQSHTWRAIRECVTCSSPDAWPATVPVDPSACANPPRGPPVAAGISLISLAGKKHVTPGSTSEPQWQFGHHDLDRRTRRSAPQVLWGPSQPSAFVVFRGRWWCFAAGGGRFNQ